MVKSEHINPFVEATVETFETMCGAKPRRDGDLAIRKGVINTYDLLGVLGLSGKVKGAVLLSMPIDVGQKMISAFTAEDVEEIDADFMDAYGEILNIICGKLKTE